jgi:hypothetical protein
VVSLALAAALHGGAVGWALLLEPPQHKLVSGAIGPGEVEVSLLVEPARARSAGKAPVRSANELSVRRAPLTRADGAGAPRPITAQAGEWALYAPNRDDAAPNKPPPDGEPARPHPDQRRRSLEALGIGGGAYRSRLMDLYRDSQAPPDVGGLRRGLAERDAARGLGASGAAVSAAHGAALARGPKSGTALFDVIVNGEGRVVSVTIVQARPDFEQWRAVASDLTSRLKGRRLRVPPNSVGVRTRLEVAVGQDAKELAHRENPPPLLPRGSFREDSVGESRLPARADRAESTREHLDSSPPALSPTLGVGAPRKSGATAVGRSHRVWVRVIGETVL